MKMSEVMKYDNKFTIGDKGIITSYIINSFKKERKVNIDGIKRIRICNDGSICISGKYGVQWFKVNADNFGIYTSIKKYLKVKDVEEVVKEEEE